MIEPPPPLVANGGICDTLKEEWGEIFFVGALVRNDAVEKREEDLDLRF